ncbi:response regulator [Ideonella sp. YS5]|uniref:response regulator n=1 Tax=Ideonella sp. YS5 TaxID=3453714 RepID=UPI003EED5B2D
MNTITAATASDSDPPTPAPWRPADRAARAVIEAHQWLLHAEGEQALLARVCGVLRERLACRSAWAGCVAEGSGGRLEMRAWAGEEAAPPDGHLPAADLAALVLSDGVARHGPGDSSLFACCALPLKDEQAGVVGVLVLESPAAEAVRPHELELLGELSRHLAFGVVQMRARQQRGQAQAALRAREERLRTLLEKIHAAVVVHGPDTSIQICNAHARLLLGLDDLAVQGKKASDPQWRFLRDDGSPMPLQEYPVVQVASRREAVRNMVAGVRRPGQDDVWLLVSADPVFDEEGQIAETIVTFVDITQRKQAEDARRRSQQAYASLVNTIDGIVWEADVPSLCFSFVSPQAERLLGFPIERWFEPDFWKDHIHPDDRDWGIDFREASMRELSAQEFFYRFYAADGRVVWLHDRVTVIFEDGRATKLRGVMVDITGRRRLQMIERMRAGALEKLIGGEGLSDILDSIVRAVEQLQPPMIASVMLLDEGRRHLRPAAGPSLPAFYNEALQGLEIGPAAGSCGTAAHTGERVIVEDVRKDPLWAPYRELAARAGLVSCWTQPVLNREGRVMGTVAVYHREPRAPNADDIELMEAMAGLVGVAVEYRRTQDEIRTLNAELERRVRQRTADLLVARDAAEAASRAKGDFLANMSHEIRTPMNAILGLSHLAMHSGLTPRQHNYVQKVHASAESLLGILNDILDFSKIEAGKLDIESIAFDLADVMDNLAGVIGLKAEEKDLELVLEQPADLPTALVGDPSRLRQILLNLCNNAVKFTERGEVEVGIEVLEHAWDAVRLRFVVRDTGLGMSPEQCERLFQPFEQADASTSRRFGGTGLGLAISHRLTQLMGGDIGVRSEVGRGSEFHFDLGFALQPGAARGPRVLRHAAFATLRTLVVDDNACAREQVLEMLDAAGMRADAAEGGDEALERLVLADAERTPYDLVLLDWKMPGMNGLECAERLRRLPLSRRRPPAVLMLSAFSRDEVLQRAQERRIVFADLLTKPVTPSSLFDACCKALGLAPVFISSVNRRDGLLSHTHAALRGARLLLVEDNAINRELALDLLSNAGVEVQVAGDGREALDILSRGSFDGVLMDCQMPVMDGFAAARAIRLRPQWRDLPVIAMTANAMVGDREKVIAAGMNDHIAKPIKVDEMFATLARWVRPRRGGEADDRPAGTPGGTGEWELPGIVPEAAIPELQANRPLYRRLLRRFRVEQTSFETSFAAARAAGQHDQAMRLVHDLHGLAGTLGIPALRHPANALKQACQRAAPDAEIDALLRQVTQQLAPVLAGLVALDGD